MNADRMGGTMGKMTMDNHEHTYDRGTMGKMTMDNHEHTYDRGTEQKTTKGNRGQQSGFPIFMMLRGWTHACLAI